MLHIIQEEFFKKAKIFCFSHRKIAFHHYFYAQTLFILFFLSLNDVFLRMIFHFAHITPSGLIGLQYIYIFLSLAPQFYHFSKKFCFYRQKMRLCFSAKPHAKDSDY